MYDNSLFYSARAEKSSEVLSKNNITPDNYILATIHRPSNTDKSESILDIFNTLNEISKKEDKKVIIPFLDMIMLEKNAAFIITDSGGVQKEAFFFNKKCLVLREETEWVEIINNNAGVLSQNSKNSIIDAHKKLMKLTPNFENLYGDGSAAEFICNKISTI